MLSNVFPLLSIAVLLFVMIVFMLASPPLLILKHDTPTDGRFIRGLFNIYYNVVIAVAGLGAAGCALLGQGALALAMGCLIVFVFEIRRRVLSNMDKRRGAIAAGADSKSVSKFRRLHIAGMLLNVAQIGVVAWGMTRLATRNSGPAEAGEVSLPVPRRALTGRDAGGKSVFKSFDVTPNVVPIDSNPGLTFYELYSTEGAPTLTGHEPDPMLRKTKAFPGPGGTNFRLISYPPMRPPGWKPPVGVTFESALKELGEKVPGMAEYFDRSAPGMHATDTVDYCVVVRGEMTLELDDGKIMRFRQGDCIVQNGTRHRWRNPGSEPCLMAFVSVGGRRAG